MPVFLGGDPGQMQPTYDAGADFCGTTQEVRHNNGLIGGQRMRISRVARAAGQFSGRQEISRPDYVRPQRMNIEARAGNLAFPQDYGLPLGNAAYGAGLADAHEYGGPSTLQVVGIGAAVALGLWLLTSKASSQEA